MRKRNRRGGSSGTVRMMVCILFLLVALSSHSQRRLKTSDKEYKAISELLTRKSMALINRDTATLLRITDPGFVYINALGAMLTREAYIAGIAGGKLRFVSQRAEISSIVKTGKVYCVTATLRDEFFYDGERVVASFSTVNIFTGKRKKLLWTFGQSTTIAK